MNDKANTGDWSHKRQSRQYWSRELQILEPLPEPRTTNTGATSDRQILVPRTTGTGGDTEATNDRYRSHERQVHVVRGSSIYCRLWLQYLWLQYLLFVVPVSVVAPVSPVVRGSTTSICRLWLQQQSLVSAVSLFLWFQSPVPVAPVSSFGFVVRVSSTISSTICRSRIQQSPVSADRLWLQYYLLSFDRLWLQPVLSQVVCGSSSLQYLSIACGSSLQYHLLSFMAPVLVVRGSSSLQYLSFMAPVAPVFVVCASSGGCLLLVVWLQYQGSPVVHGSSILCCRLWLQLLQSVVRVSNTTICCCLWLHWLSLVAPVSSITRRCSWLQSPVSPVVHGSSSICISSRSWLR